MKNVLIADDEKSFLLGLVDGFKEYLGDFTVWAAENGKIATEILQGTKIDLVVTDLQMPVMDGFELLAYMSRNHPSTPVIILTAFGSPETEAKLRALGVSHYLEKPLKFDTLASKVYEKLEAGAKGHIQGVSLTFFLQLLELDKKTCTLIIRSKGKEGHLYFNKGLLIDATTGTLEGEEAAYEIMDWEQMEIEIEDFCKKKKKNIDHPYVLLEGLRSKEEKERIKQERSRKDGELIAKVLEKQFLPLEVDTNQNFNQRKVNIMPPQDKLKELAAIEGFVGTGLFTPTGETLALLATDGKVNIKDIGILANNVLRNAQKASLDMGTGRGQLVHVEAEHAHIIVRCLNEGNDPLKSEPGKAHIHLVLVLNSEASLGLAKLKVGSIIGALAPEFRG